jgi:hypothetical protein
MRSSVLCGALALALALLGGAGAVRAADDAARGVINRGAEEAQRPPTGAPAGVMQQSGAGSAVRDVPASNTPSGAFPASKAAAPDAVTDNANTGLAPSGPAGSESGPIGATGHTMPAKFSERNAALDKTPIMAHPLPLSDEQKRTVYEALAANGDVETRALDTEPANALPADVKLYDLPPRVAEQFPALRHYKYVRLTDKVVLVSAPNRIVAGELTR